MINFVEDLAILKKQNPAVDMTAATARLGHIAAEAIKHQFLDPQQSRSGLRLSSIGDPALVHLAKKFYPLPDEQLDSRSLIRFYEGLAFEGLALFLMEYLGYGIVSTQDEVEWNGVKGHTDGRIFCPHTQMEWLIEMKTMSDYSFKKTVKEGTITDTKYIAQMATYTEATSLPGIWICYNKSSHEIITILPDEEVLEASRKRCKFMLEKLPLCESFEDGFQYFRTPPVIRSHNSVSVPYPMSTSPYVDLFYECEVRQGYTKANFPYYKVPEGLEDMRDEWASQLPPRTTRTA